MDVNGDGKLLPMLIAEVKRSLTPDNNTGVILIHKNGLHGQPNGQHQLTNVPTNVINSNTDAKLVTVLQMPPVLPNMVPKDVNLSSPRVVCVAVKLLRNKNQNVTHDVVKKEPFSSPELTDAETTLLKL